MKKISKGQEVSIKEIIGQLSVLKNDLLGAEMYKSYHALDEAIKVAGWEFAEKLGQDPAIHEHYQKAVAKHSHD